MAYPNIDELLNSIDNRYRLCMAVAKRAKQLNIGARPLVNGIDTDKVTMIALEEILSGKVRVKDKGMNCPNGDPKTRKGTEDADL